MAIFAPHIIEFFRKDDMEVIAVGTFGLRMQCIGLPFGALMIMVNMMTQTMGKTLEASVIALSRQGVCLIPSLFILSPLLGLNGVQMASPISELMSLVIVIPIMIRTLKALTTPVKNTA
jgi:Na+-driven multidrug efflux pump